MMSLVAYGSSEEESDSSDHEDLEKATGLSETTSASAVSNEKNGHQRATKEAQFSNDEIFPVKGKSLVLPSPKNKSNAQVSSACKDQTTNSSLQGKEKDVLSSSLVSESEDEIIDIEEEYIPLSQKSEKSTEKQGDIKPKSVGSLFSLLPPPWQSDRTWQKKGKDAEQKMTKQPVKISIPSAPQLDSDEEENSDEPTTKKMRTSKGCSGLKSLLPKPKHGITIKADNANKPAVKLSNRPLIPYTLTRNAKKGQADIKKSAKVEQSNEAGSDDDETPVNFFTFGDNSSIPVGNVDQEGNCRDSNIDKVESRDEVLNVAWFSSEAMNLRVPAVSRCLTTASTIPSQNANSKHDETFSHSSSEAAGSQQVNSVGFYKEGEPETRTYVYQQDGQTVHEYGGYATNNPGNTCVAQPYSNYDWEAYNTSTNPTGVAELTQNPAQERNIDLEKLHKLQGRKNRREEINIVDVNADDQIGDSAVLLTKYGTEEIAHRPSRKKSDMPTAQQRRKHQITYLAFQAKERELELRQQWSANRQTRRQTQSKYGF